MSDPFLASDKRNQPKDTNNQWWQNSSNVVNSPISTWQAIQQRQIPKKQVKQWKKLSFKAFMIGCFIVWLFLLVAWWLVIYSLMQSQTTLESYWIDRESLRKLLIFFSTLFFGIVFFISFIMLLVNIYRLATVQVWKWKHIVWSSISFVFLSMSLLFGTLVFNKISQLRPANEIRTNNIVDAFLLWWSWFEYLYWSVRSIAPLEMNYKFNIDSFMKREWAKIWSSSNITKVSMECGNNKTLSLNMWTWKFLWSCLYLNKWGYNIKLNYAFINNQWTEIFDSLDLWEITVDAEIEVQVEDWKLQLSDNLDELLVWIAPARVTFNANKIFSDLKIPGKPEINWDLNWDGKLDSTNILSRYIYDSAQLYNVVFTLPQINKDFQYLIRLRVNQSDIPECVLTVAENKLWHRIQAQVDKTYTIKEYNYDLIDISTWEIVDSFKKSTPSTVYKIKTNWKYEIRLTAVTSDNKKSSCKSSVIDTTVWEYKTQFDILSKLREQREYQKVILENGKVIVDTIPMDFRLNIKSIVWSQWNELIKVMLNDEEVDEVSSDSYEFSIDESQDKTLSILIIDEQWRESKTQVEFEVAETPLIWVMKASPQTWEDPLMVELDASTSQINDPDDEIIYFTWNFGDWQVMKNVSVWKVNHKYSFDLEKQSWIYYPTVEIFTKKWHNQIVKLKNPIIVKRQEREVRISFDSHPTQTASTNSPVKFSVITDWNVKKVSWDFGDWKVYNCDWRECMTATSSYDKDWMFNVTVTVEYTDYPSISKTEKIKIIN